MASEVKNRIWKSGLGIIFLRALCLFNDLYNKINNIEIYCTMKNGKKICNITIEKPDKKVFVKFPKLVELYKLMFNETPENLHDAKVDALVCLRCFLKMELNVDIDILSLHRR